MYIYVCVCVRACVCYTVSCKYQSSDENICRLCCFNVYSFSNAFFGLAFDVDFGSKTFLLIYRANRAVTTEKTVVFRRDKIIFETGRNERSFNTKRTLCTLSAR